MLRPLLLATAGSGVMVLGLLQFSADMFAQVEAAGRPILVHAVRTAFFAFLSTSAALLGAYLFRVYRSPRMALIFNSFGAVVFLVAVLFGGGQIGGALIHVPGVEPRMPVMLSLFFVVSIGGAILLLLAALAAFLRALVRSARATSTGPSDLDEGAA